MPSPPTETEWDHQYDTLRRQKLFQQPPTDHSAYPALQEAVNPHIRAFNRLFPTDGSPGLLAHAIADIGYKTYLDGNETMALDERNKLRIRIKDVTLEKPRLPSSNKLAQCTKGISRKILPSECRLRHATYRGKLCVKFEYDVNHGKAIEFERTLGQLPIMVKSNHCHLENNSPALLVRRKEESEELGGYFIVNGVEKFIRLLQINKRNFPLAIEREAFKRTPEYSHHGIIIRSVRPDETPQTNVLHYLNDGNVIFRFAWRKYEYLVPIMMILKALLDTNDREIYEGIIGPLGCSSHDNIFLADRVEILLRTYKIYGLKGRFAARAHLGNKFRKNLGIPTTMSDYEAGTEFLRKVVLVHLGNVDVTDSQNEDKFRLLLFMLRKLYALADGECAVDNPDAVQNQELLLGGFLYGQILKERLDDFLDIAVRSSLQKNRDVCFTSGEFNTLFPTKIFASAGEDIGKGLEYFLSTGNMTSRSGLDLQQTSGFTVVAEKLNFLRFLSHFRSVHRGAFFAQLKTTAPRKLLPESWGFLCPVHTPDGAPCGLLNHLAHKCHIMTEPLDVSALPGLVAELGVVETSTASTQESVVVMLDGKVLGWCSPVECRRMAHCFRHWKVEGTNDIPLQLEIGYVPPSNGGTYPGMFMSSRPSRLVRPVKYLPLQAEDFVGSFEQPYMSIAVVPHEIESGESTHVEFAPTNILSILANMTPFSDFNQSPRNMYQCQMGKQTMGTPATALRGRSDEKLYMLLTGQTPVVRPPLHNTYGFDNFPNGTNAVVAVMSYTGYDMDDAMIINQSADERGFGYGTIYKTKFITLKDTKRRTTIRTVAHVIGFAPDSFVSAESQGMLDKDGLPHVGRMLRSGDVICAYHSVTTDFHGKLTNLDGVTRFKRYTDEETCFVEEVRLLGAETGDELLQTVSIKLRIPRGPVVGDKFSSRHGQKGVCSRKWPTIDMPFSESGMQPDIIINPHAFPSRMTIGMFIESLAGKAGALHGLAQDSTPFQFDEEDNTATDYFGKQLIKAGFNYHGNEPMYSGITGEELGADIFVGLVYYQRLRHMVNDKYQIRTIGPVEPTTMQPVHGRQRGGGIRVGEMERDALLAHGTAFLLQDRLFNCSDYCPSWICRRCGSFLSVQPVVPRFAIDSRQRAQPSVFRCRSCAVRLKEGVDLTKVEGEIWEDGQGVSWAGGDDTTLVAIPGALRFLDVELAAMGVKLKYNVSDMDKIRKGPLRPLPKP
ncbi:hypothetical protein CP533_2991 [Ophiocordyceps camponoti-saundersi (nom. inval.)]|nr:hypothetical protein CP533_2991 [Ophiocordyceps camponoti-saundersi (nom. inval.)]